VKDFTFADVVSATGARVVGGDARTALAGVSTDTRSVRPGELFVALSGPNFDGNRFAARALAEGAGGLLLRGDERARLPRALAGVGLPVAFARDPRRALGDLAAWRRRRSGATVVGVTGSCGKTTTKAMLIELAGAARRASGSRASFNNDVGVPLTLLEAPRDAEVLVVEMGTNAPGEIAALCRIARPDGALVTNVGAAHLEGLGSLEGVAREKGALVAAVPAAGFVVLNANDPRTSAMARLTAARVLTFGLDARADVYAEDLWFHAGGTTFRLCGGPEVTIPLLGRHMVLNVLAALAACRGLGIELAEVLPALARLAAQHGRLERFEVGGVTLLDDTYNANPESARASLRVLAGLHGHARRVLVLGDMHELGPAADDLHREVGAQAARAGVDLLVVAGERARVTAQGALAAGLPAPRVVCFRTVEAALDGVPELLADGDVVLVKGSRAAGLERIVERVRSAASAHV
jgi:UDP-N-acetylmuramoyl-tripeptide--D-alanyl-D-alanine ligase